MNHGETDRFHSEADGPNLCRYLLAMENDNEKMCFFSIPIKVGLQRFQKHMCTVKHYLQMLFMRVKGQ